MDTILGIILTAIIAAPAVIYRRGPTSKEIRSNKHDPIEPYVSFLEV